MNRRSFIRSLIAGVVMLAAPKAVLPVQIPKCSGNVARGMAQQRYVWDTRRRARQELNRWANERYNKVLSEVLKGDHDGN